MKKTILMVSVIFAIMFSVNTVYALKIVEYTIPGPACYPIGILSDKNGDIWFNCPNGRIDKLSNGEFTEYPIFPMSSGSITMDPSGDIWFVSGFGSTIGKLLILA